MDEPCIGCQASTQSVSIPCSAARGQETVDFYNSSGHTAQPWQELLIYDVLVVNEEDPAGAHQVRLCRPANVDIGIWTRPVCKNAGRSFLF